MTKIYKTWIERLESGVITYGQMRSFVEGVGGWLYDSRPSGKRTSLTAEEADDLYVRLTNLPDGLDLIGYASRNQWVVQNGKNVRVTWKEFGRNWIATTGKRSGVPKDLVAAAAELDFRFVDIAASDRGRNYAPVYRAFTPDGRSWRYTPWPWQVKVWG